MSFKLPLLAAAAAVSLLGASAAQASTPIANIYAGYYQDNTWMYYWNMSGVTFDDAKINSVGGLFPGQSEDEGSLPSGWTESVNFNDASGAFASDYDDANSADPCPGCDTSYQFAVTIGSHTYLSNVFSPSSNLTGGLVDFTGNHADQDTIRCSTDGCFGFALVGQVVAGGVPEPATWSLMIGGFGLAGAALRRRKAVAAA